MPGRLLRFALVALRGRLALRIAAMTTVSPVPAVPEEVRAEKHDENQDPEPVLS
jgi:hypothetical protein